MFYESIGTLLGQAGDSIAADDPNVVVDERAQRERRQTTKLLRRIGAIWPQLFQALDEESSILDATLRTACEAARTHHLAEISSTAGSEADPLTRYRRLLCELDELVIQLHEHSDETWAQDALRSVRGGLADAAEVQGRLVDHMLTV